VVPNVSEGREAATIAACAEAVRATGVDLADVSSDRDHNRSVFTFFGDAQTVVEASAALATACRDLIDLRKHHGVHPRFGALDVLPFVPFGSATLEDAASVARLAAVRIWELARIPSFLYGAASPEGRSLPQLRRAAAEMHERTGPAEPPDVGEIAFHPTAGAVAVGAREVLVAFNIILTGCDLSVARRIASTVRESGGGLKTLRALGLEIGGGRVQISCNVCDVDAVPLDRLTALVRRLAVRAGAAVEGCELVGLAPRRVFAHVVDAAFGRHERVYEAPAAEGKPL